MNGNNRDKMGTDMDEDRDRERRDERGREEMEEEDRGRMGGMTGTAEDMGRENVPENKEEWGEERRSEDVEMPDEDVDY